MMQTELKTMREFRRKRAELKEQLQAMQEALDTTQHEHKQQLTGMEQKFFEEKVCPLNSSSFFFFYCRYAYKKRPIVV